MQGKNRIYKWGEQKELLYVDSSIIAVETVILSPSSLTESYIYLHDLERKKTVCW